MIRIKHTLPLINEKNRTIISNTQVKHANKHMWYTIVSIASNLWSFKKNYHTKNAMKKCM